LSFLSLAARAAVAKSRSELMAEIFDPVRVQITKQEREHQKDD
jgi:hypothetical protein